MALTLEWVGRPDEGPWPPGTASPPADALMQLFYRLNLLYGEAFRLDQFKGRHHGYSGSSWYRTYPEWRRMLRRYPFATPSRPTPPLTQWPTRAPIPPIAPEVALRFEAVTMASPLDLIFDLPPVVLAWGGAAGVLSFIQLLEKVWNAPKRIRLEGLELDRKIYEEEEALEDVRRKHQGVEWDGFALREGSAEFSGEWKWPKGRRS